MTLIQTEAEVSEPWPSGVLIVCLARSSGGSDMNEDLHTHETKRPGGKLDRRALERVREELRTNTSTDNESHDHHHQKTPDGGTDQQPM